jgi:hypothetical protein
MLRDYSLNDFKNKRLQGLKMKIDHLKFEVQCVPGKRNKEADALLWAPIDQATVEVDIDKIENILESINAINVDLKEEFYEFNKEVSDLLIKKFEKEGEKDPDYQLLGNAVWAVDYWELIVKLNPYVKYLDVLCIDDNGLIIKNTTNLVIPEGIRIWWIDYLQNLHPSPEKIIKRAKKYIRWVFINFYLKQRRRTWKCVSNGFHQTCQIR